MKSRINSFFIEIIIVILFFALSVTVILQLFVAAHNKSVSAGRYNISIIKAQEITEEFKAYSTAGGKLGFLEDSGTKIYSDTSSDSAFIYYDENWNVTDTLSAYKLDISVRSEDTQSGTMLYSSVSVYSTKSSEELICRLDSQKYISEPQTKVSLTEGGDGNE